MGFVLQKAWFMQNENAFEHIPTLWRDNKRKRQKVNAKV